MQYENATTDNEWADKNTSHWVCAHKESDWTMRSRCVLDVARARPASICRGISAATNLRRCGAGPTDTTTAVGTD